MIRWLKEFIQDWITLKKHKDSGTQKHLHTSESYHQRIMELKAKTLILTYAKLLQDRFVVLILKAVLRHIGFEISRNEHCWWLIILSYCNQCVGLYDAVLCFWTTICIALKNYARLDKSVSPSIWINAHERKPCKIWKIK